LKRIEPAEFAGKPNPVTVTVEPGGPLAGLTVIFGKAYTLSDAVRPISRIASKIKETDLLLNPIPKTISPPCYITEFVNTIYARVNPSCYSWEIILQKLSNMYYNDWSSALQR
jgi:hypothetical protein